MRAVLTSLAEVAGIGLIAAGCWVLLPAAGLIAAGIGLVVLGYAGAA